MKHVPLLVASFLLLAATSCSKESAASGSSGTRLALTKPSNQSMTQGGSEKVGISIDRTGFADPVSVTFSNLPEGVRVDGDTIMSGDSKKDFVLVASPTAPVVEKKVVTVTAKGAGITTSQTFELTVKAKS